MTEPTSEPMTDGTPTSPSSGAPEVEPKEQPPGLRPEDQETGNDDPTLPGSIQGADPQTARDVSGGEEQDDQPAATEQPSVTPADSGISDAPA